VSPHVQYSIRILPVLNITFVTSVDFEGSDDFKRAVLWKQEMEARMQEEENARLLNELRVARSLPNGNMYGYSNGSLTRGVRNISIQQHQQMHHSNGSSHSNNDYNVGYEEPKHEKRSSVSL